MSNSDPLRQQLAKLLDWQDAHVGFESVVEGIPEKLRGAQPTGFPHSAWQLLEHMRLAQKDILDFCVDPEYEEQKWPDDYWPKRAAPPSASAWDESVSAFKADREAVQRLALDPTIDLLAKVPNGTGQTYLREILLVADHNAYHLGQIVAVRRLLGIWAQA